MWECFWLAVYPLTFRAPDTDFEGCIAPAFKLKCLVRPPSCCDLSWTALLLSQARRLELPGGASGALAQMNVPDSLRSLCQFLTLSCMRFEPERTKEEFSHPLHRLLLLTPAQPDGFWQFFFCQRGSLPPTLVEIVVFFASNYVDRYFRPRCFTFM